MEDLKTMKKQVESILERHPDSRNCDFYLILLWLKENIPEFNSIWLDYKLIRSLGGKLETITRARRKLNAEGKYKPTDPEVIRKRQIRERKIRQFIGSGEF